ncbi:NAD(P)(+) transhydrogenase (Re/Si-specific) subunit beta [Burkholderia sp. WSM2232]|uniref:NAD(P)(+) transhydrogenase (Re/Si-specific) subunit beta n=1 Tax=Burkholderia sp. WSM2232 TaxID=944436 RepID=UPI00040325F6|nr:NAD(P)(+) transhydrogenase (Re/Si-specific) subunit beta [Burkholderia sp. WSM2232]
MPQASGSAVWLGAFVALSAACAALLACALGSVFAAQGQRPLWPRSGAARRERPSWHAAALAAGLAGVLATGLGASESLVFATVAGAAAGALLVRRRNFTRQAALVALLASGMGLSIVAVGVARYVSPGNQANLAMFERIELYAAVFVGALMFATSAVAFCKLRGLLPLRVTARCGHDAVNVLALLLCVWLGYGFVTEAAQPFGLAALLGMSALASSIGVHVMLSRAYSRAHKRRPRHSHGTNRGAAGGMAIAWRDDETRSATVPGMVRAAAYRHGPRWHNKGIRQRSICVCAPRRLSNRAAVGRHP